MQSTKNFPLVNVSGWVKPTISISFYFNPNTIMRPHIGHLRFSVRVLKKTIQSCTRKAEDSNHRLKRKTRMLQICHEPTEPQKPVGVWVRNGLQTNSNKVGKEKR